MRSNSLSLRKCSQNTPTLTSQCSSPSPSRCTGKTRMPPMQTSPWSRTICLPRSLRSPRNKRDARPLARPRIRSLAIQLCQRATRARWKDPSRRSQRRMTIVLPTRTANRASRQSSRKTIALPKRRPLATSPSTTLGPSPPRKERATTWAFWPAISSAAKRPPSLPSATLSTPSRPRSGRHRSTQRLAAAPRAVTSDATKARRRVVRAASIPARRRVATAASMPTRRRSATAAPNVVRRRVATTAARNVARRRVATVASMPTRRRSAAAAPNVVGRRVATRARSVRRKRERRDVLLLQPHPAPPQCAANRRKTVVRRNPLRLLLPCPANRQSVQSLRDRALRCRATNPPRNTEPIASITSKSSSKNRGGSKQLKPALKKTSSSKHRSKQQQQASGCSSQESKPKGGRRRGLKTLSTEGQKFCKKPRVDADDYAFSFGG